LLCLWFLIVNFEISILGLNLILSPRNEAIRILVFFEVRSNVVNLGSRYKVVKLIKHLFIIIVTSAIPG
jgi:hypothetical protein